jgi:4'-phosphopantetheinyl transferase
MPSSNNLVWCSTPADVALPADEVPAWRAELHNSERVGGLSSVLSAAEKERASRFQYDRDKKRFVACRAILRIILSRYSGVDARRLEFEYGTHGKPSLKTQTRIKAPLRFSSSRSHGLSFFAVTLNQEIGIDTEYIRPVPDRDEIVNRYFTTGEWIIYSRLAPDQKQPAFFNGWTRKEAYLKAIGVGLNQPLRTVEVSLEPGEPARLLRIEGNARQAAAWSLYELSLGTDYAGVVAVKGSYGLRLWKWEQADKN